MLHPVWTTEYSRVNSTESQIVAMRPSTDSAIYLWCRTHPTVGGKEGTLVKMNRQAQIVWEIHFAHPSASNAWPADIHVDEKGLLVCLSLEFTNSNTGIMTASISMEGQIQWAHVYTGGIGVAAYSICRDSTGGVAVAGIQNKDSLLIKLDGEGTCQWVQVRDGEYGGNNFWLRVRPGLNGEVYTRGVTYVPAGPGTFDHIAFHSATGTVRWESVPGTDTSGFLITDSSGNAYIGDSYVYKLNPMGSKLWTVNTTGGPPLNMQLTSDEQTILYAGNLRVSGKFRYHMSRLSTTGRVEWSRIVYNEYNPPDSWQPLAATFDTSLFSYVSGNRGIFLFNPDGELYLKISGEYDHLVAIGHNELFASVNPATIFYLNGFPAYSENHFRFYDYAPVSSSDFIQTWVPSKNGQVVRVEVTDDLAANAWAELPPIISTGLITEVEIPLTNNALHFRVRADP